MGVGFIATLVLANLAWALNPNVDVASYSTRTWYSDDGLPHNSITSMAQTKDGYLWFATWNGLARYNGREFKVFSSRSTPQIGGVRAIVPSPHGALLIATARSGLLVYRDGRISKLDRSHGLPSDALMSLHVAPDGKIWVGTQGQGLAQIDHANGLVVSKTVQDPLLDKSWIQAILQDADGTLWIGTTRGLRIWRDGKVQAVPLSQAPSEPQSDKLGPSIYALLRDHAGVLWVGSEQGLYRLQSAPNQTIAFVPYKLTSGSAQVAAGGSSQTSAQIAAGGSNQASATALREPAVQSLFEDRDQSLWIGTQSEGLLRKHEDQLSQLTTTRGLSNNRVLSIVQDREGSLWVGTNSGLMRFNDTGFSRVGRDERLSDEFVRSISPGQISVSAPLLPAATSTGAQLVQANAQAVSTLASTTAQAAVIASLPGITSPQFCQPLNPKQAIEGMWVGTSSGLNFVTEGLALPVLDPVVAKLSVTSVLQARDGSLWVGTYDDGLWLCRNGQWRHFQASDTALPHAQVRALMQTKDGSIWVGTAQGAIKLRLQNEQDYQVEFRIDRRQSFRSTYITSLLESSDGRIWLGTSDGVIVLPGCCSQWDWSQAQQLGPEQGFPASDVFDFYQDSTGILWIATDKGLVRYSENKFSLFGRAAGLPVDTIFAVFEDRAGVFWLTSSEGLLQLPRAQLDAHLSNDSLLLAPLQFARADGMSAAQINGSSDPSGNFDRIGRLWLPTARGVTVLEPTGVEKRVIPAVPIVIESVLIDQIEQDMRLTIKTISRATRYEINYAGLSFVAPERIRYRYRLAGYDETWFNAGSERRALFSKLPPGEFRFEVQAASDNAEFGASKILLLSVQPRLIERRWFWWAMAAFFSLLAAILVRLVMRQQQRRRMALEALVAQRTMELKERNDVLAAANQDKSELLKTIQAQSQAFARQAREDYLTGIANRRFFDLRAEAAFANRNAPGDNTCFAIADIDHFKRINDSYSHDIGDQVLRLVALTIANVVGKDGLAARFGGEEFGIYWQPMTLPEAQQRCEQILKLVSELVLDEAPDLRVTISIGLTDAQHLPSYGRAMVRADSLLYAAKARGRNCVVTN